jgi:hypothetical protein
MMIVMIAAMGMCACIVSIALFFWMKNGGKFGGLGGGKSKRNLKGDAPEVAALVKGEKVADVVGSTMFTDLYPGVQVQTRNATDKSALPAGPAFVLLQDAKGTVVGVDAAGSI